ncbi:MAG: dihydrofolate reductase, partial [Burkholderiales bacterium]|nr:dihydrofolate reductase [Burkholderiales bacterium]
REWIEVSRERHASEAGLAFDYVTYERRRAAPE